MAWRHHQRGAGPVGRCPGSAVGDRQFAYLDVEELPEPRPPRAVIPDQPAEHGVGFEGVGERIREGRIRSPASCTLRL